MIKQFVVTLLALLCLQLALSAQAYTIQLGTFFEPRLENFDPIRGLGFVYAEHTEGNAYRVYLGDFANRTDTQSTMNKLKQKGYMDAFVVEIDLRMGQNAPVIQLAARAPQERIKWDAFFELGIPIYVLSEKGKTKITSAPFRSQETALARLKQIQGKGFSDAFLKTVNTALLHKVGAFELGGQKQPLIPINIVEGRRPEPVAVPESKDLATRGNMPQSFDFVPANQEIRSTEEVATTASAASVERSLAVPRIRTNVKRRSVLNLQKMLKSMNAYAGSLDGLYGKGTAKAYQTITEGNLKFQQYQLLSEYMALEVPSSIDSKEQAAIDALWENTDGSFEALRASQKPIAKAYRAYWMFATNGRSSGVNSLMNDAVAMAFQNKPPSERPPLDVQATYAYNDLDQLLRHLIYIDKTDSSVKIPCWMLERHPKETRSALASLGGVYAADVSACYSFDQWEIVRILQTLALDFNANTTLDAKRMEKAAAARGQLFLVPASLDQAELEDLLSWDKKLWETLEIWATADPLHQKLMTPLKLAYFQTQVQLEDHYMDRDFGPSQAKGLSLAVLQSLVGYHLERFL
ncbi:MAG: SPOR domain-containing protein [Bacteroidota bacterium]